MTNSPEAIERLFEERVIKSESGTTRDATDGRVANRLRNRDKVIDAISLLVSFESYDLMLRQLGRSVETIAAT